MRPLTATQVAEAAEHACQLEASAPKPGNVSPGRPFRDLRYEDFIAAAAAINTPFAGVGERPVGETVKLAIEATAARTRSNANLGIVLLLAPLARAAIVASGNDLRATVCEVLDETTVDDARNVYLAIRLAGPGGLGEADDQDVTDEPDVTLLETMTLAAARDGVAREYATGFEVTFESAAPTLGQARRDGLGWDDAIIETFLTLLAKGPDTHIVRRSGAALAAEVSGRAREVLAAGGVRSEAGRRAISVMDLALRDPGNSANPGTAADLTAAAIFVELLAEA